MRYWILLLLTCGLLSACNANDKLTSLQLKIQQCAVEQLSTDECQKVSKAQKIVESAILILQSNPKLLGDEILATQVDIQSLNDKLAALEPASKSDEAEDLHLALRNKKEQLKWYMAVVSHFESPA